MGVRNATLEQLTYKVKEEEIITTSAQHPQVAPVNNR